MRAFRVPFSAAFLASRITFLVALSRCRLAARSSSFFSSSSERRAYQTSSVRISANAAIASRYARTAARVDSRASDSVNPLFLAAIVKLAASRLTSYSNGPGKVSSKSFRSSSSTRSGEANMPKFDKWASPHSWVVSPAVGVCRRSAAMTLAAPR